MEQPQHLDGATCKKIISLLSELVTEKRSERIQQVLSERTRHIAIVLENVFQPHNISAVMRSCDCFGVQDLHVIENNNDFVTNDDIALGASKWLSIHRYNQKANNTRSCLSQLKQQGYQIAALTLNDQSIPMKELDISQKTALCIGTEETGLTNEAHKLADVFVQIPMVGFTQSFNLSVTAALGMYELRDKLKDISSHYKLSEREQEILTLDWLVNTLPNGEKMLKHYLKTLSL